MYFCPAIAEGIWLAMLPLYESSGESWKASAMSFAQNTTAKAASRLRPDQVLGLAGGVASGGGGPSG